MKTYLFGIGLLAFALAARAEVEVIALHYRTVDEMLPLVRPMLDADGAANGMDYQLVIRSSAGNIAQIRQLVQQLDRAPRRLNITVLQNVDGETARRLIELAGRASVGRAQVSAGAVHNGNGILIATGRSGDQAQVHIDAASQSATDDKAQQIQVQEGKQALITIGQSYAVPQREVIQYPGRSQVVDSVHYREVGSGFFVLPRVSGDRVSLEISTQNDALQSVTGDGVPTVRTQRIATTVYGRLGEWIELGNVLQQTSSDGSTLTSDSTSSARERRNVLLKVELLN